MSGKRVLVVDDSAYTGEAVAWALLKAGYEPLVARDLWDLERVSAGKPDLVFMDVVLSEAFGDDLAPLLRDMYGFTCPIVLFSSLPEAELAQRASDSGVDGYVSKRAGLSAIVARANEMLGGSSTATAPRPLAPFDLAARLRLRRIVHVHAVAQNWNAPAIVAEAHALAGDADLAGSAAVGDAARALRDAVQRHATGPNADVMTAIARLAEAGGGMPGAPAGMLLVVDPSGFVRESLYPGLDEHGFVMIEAASLAEARQKLTATEYQLILVDDRLQRDDAALVPELRSSLPGVRLEIVGVEPLAKSIGAARLVDEIRSLARRA